MNVEDVWGIGRQNTAKLNQLGIYTALGLKNAPDEWIKKNLGGVVGLRTLHELRGISCINLELVREKKKGIVSSRSFGKPVDKLEFLEEAAASYTARACEKLRNQDSETNAITVFLGTNSFKKHEKQYRNSITYKLPYSTSYTPELVSYAIKLLKKIFREGYNYKKVGIMFLDIIPKNQTQLNLFTDDSKRENNVKLMGVMDKINSKYGSNTLKISSCGTSKTNPNWIMKRRSFLRRGLLIGMSCWLFRFRNDFQ